MKNFRKACRGQKGFTLIELLVVIIILGVLAAVVTLAVTSFIGKGTRESANAEAITVETAVQATFGTAQSDILLGNPDLVWQGAVADSPYATNGSDNATIAEFMQKHVLKAAYTFNADGDILNADPTIAGGWGNKIVWSTPNVVGGQWIKAP